MKRISEFKVTAEFTLSEVETIIQKFWLFLVESKKIQFLNNARIEEFTSGLEKDIAVYNSMLSLIDKEDEGKKVIQNLCNNIEQYFSEDEKLRYGIGQNNVVELNNSSETLSEYIEEN